MSKVLIAQSVNARPSLAFLAWGDFHARSHFASSTIPEEKWRLLVVYSDSGWPGWDSHSLLKSSYTLASLGYESESGPKLGAVLMPAFDVRKRRDKPLMTANSSYNRNRLERREHSWNIPSDPPCIVRTCHAPLHLNQAPFANHGGLWARF